MPYRMTVTIMIETVHLLFFCIFPVPKPFKNISSKLICIFSTGNEVKFTSVTSREKHRLLYRREAKQILEQAHNLLVRGGELLAYCYRGRCMVNSNYTNHSLSIFPIISLVFPLKLCSIFSLLSSSDNLTSSHICRLSPRSSSSS